MFDAVLHRTLAPLAAYYDDPTTVEVRITRPGWVVTERRGRGKERHEAPTLKLAVLHKICTSLSNVLELPFDKAASAEGTVSAVPPLLSCIIPEIKHRFECLLGPSVQSGISLAIRCKHPFVPTWEQLGADAAVLDYLQQSILRSDNILVSGATNTGKTTFLNRLLEGLPDDRRVIAAEDTPELHIDRFWDGSGLIATRGETTSKRMVTWEQLYNHCMRITPDHIIFGEISTTNSFGALTILNSGITGFMCTIHAESPQQALDRKFEQNIAWSGRAMARVPEFLRELIDVVVQIKRTTDGMRRITDIYEPRRNHWVMKDGEVK